VSKTYRNFATIVQDIHYAGTANDDATITLKLIAEITAMQVAFFARRNAFENSNNGETTFA